MENYDGTLTKTVTPQFIYCLDEWEEEQEEQRRKRKKDPPILSIGLYIKKGSITFKVCTLA